MPAPSVQTDALTYTPQPGSVRLARQRVARLLTERGWRRDAVSDAALTAAELAANALRHTPEAVFRVALAYDDGCVLIEVTDRAPQRTPRLRPAPETSCTGRGLHLVAALAATWGVSTDSGTEKTVWALVTGDATGHPPHVSGSTADSSCLLCSCDVCGCLVNASTLRISDHECRAAPSGARRGSRLACADSAACRRRLQETSSAGSRTTC